MSFDVDEALLEDNLAAVWGSLVEEEWEDSIGGCCKKKDPSRILEIKIIL